MYESAILLSQAENTSFLFAVYSWGIELIKNIQTIQSPGLTAFMKIVTSLGTEYFYIVIILFIFWCRDEKKGFSLGLLIIISAWVNGLLKVAFNQPRPYDFEPGLALAFEPSNGFPSGHAQMSMTFWIAIAVWLSFSFAKGKKFRPVIWIVSILLILLIGFSRLYLGVHFPTDVFGGWLLALIILALYFILEKPAAAFFLRAGIRFQLIIAAGAAFIMNLLHPVDTSLSAMVLGFCAGYSIMSKKFPFAARSFKGENQGLLKKTLGLNQRFPTLVLRFVIGIVGAAVIYFGLKMVIPGTGSLFEAVSLEPYYELGRFVRYALLGFWASACAPWLFLKLGIASSETPVIPLKQTSQTPAEHE